MPSSLKNSVIVEQTLFSGEVKISSQYFLQISNVISQTLLTAAPSTKVSILSNLITFQTSKAFFIDEAQFGSTHITLVSGES
jgi:hypothetical protein